VLGLDVTPEALDRFLAGGDGPIVLVNLVRLRSGGSDAYARYRDAIGPIVERVGAELVYAGSSMGTLIGDDGWDIAAVVRYPSRQALAELIHDPAFEAATPLRHEAVEDGVLYAFA